MQSRAESALQPSGHPDRSTCQEEIQASVQPFVGTEVFGPKREFVGYGRRVPRVTWPGAARVAVNIVINYEEGSEYAHPNGDGRNDGLVEMTYAMDPSYRDLCAESGLRVRFASRNLAHRTPADGSQAADDRLRVRRRARAQFRSGRLDSRGRS